jgi:UDP-N-acetylglucosamine kinase
MAEVYKPLTDAQVKIIALDYFSQRERKTKAQEQPSLCLVGGQPGAGKSKASSLVKTELQQKGGYIHVDADRMRERIPLGTAKPTSEETQPDAGRLVTELRNLAIANKRNILEEGTYRNPEGAASFIASKKAEGYRVEMLAVATPQAQSLLGIYARHEEQYASKAPNPRLVEDQYHDNAYRSFADTLSKAADQLDRTRIVNRAGELLFDSLSPHKTNVVEALVEARKLTDQNIKDVITEWAKTREMAEARNAPISFQETLKQHHESVEGIQKERINAHAMKQLDTNIAVLNSDGRFKNFSDEDMLKAAYFRGFHEKAAEFNGATPNFAKYDTAMATTSLVKDVQAPENLLERTVNRERVQSRDDDSHSL